jgi:hypothetical protein
MTIFSLGIHLKKFFIRLINKAFVNKTQNFVKIFSNNRQKLLSGIANAVRCRNYPTYFFKKCKVTLKKETNLNFV